MTFYEQLSHIQYVKTIEKHRWRVRWAGRWTTTKIAFTEEHIRREHPEAERVPGSRILVEVPETDAEREALYEATRRPPKEFR